MPPSSPDIRGELFALLDSLNCKHTVREGIVYVLTPENMLWNLTVPCNITGTKLPREVEQWVLKELRHA